MALKKFTLDTQNAKFKGVCSGLANYFGVDATFVRIGAVVITLLGAFPWTLIAYGVAVWAAKPKQKGWDDMEAVTAPRASTRDLHLNMRDIDRRMAEVDQYVASSNNSLASEIEKLR
jgi:phage shock protein C